jgi:OOP family OmpA-OmpF porin
MRKLAIAVALASTGLATPAVARDHSPYVGIEGGGMFIEDLNLDYDDGVLQIPNGYIVNHALGFDVDVIGGYDLGVVRLEAELAYKRASVDGANVDTRIAPNASGNLDGGRTSVLSGMINALLDFGNDDGLSGYIGGGAGLAQVKVRAGSGTAGAPVIHDSDSHFALQAIAGVRYAITQNIDLGLKYRFFTVPNLKFNGDQLQRLDFTASGSFRSKCFFDCSSLLT